MTAPSWSEKTTEEDQEAETAVSCKAAATETGVNAVLSELESIFT